ncbi:YebC/PmpR family DNA-binding transcriptional regulator [Lapidilactobacillus achengensis]|uniref:Probable transcriptional regulatory protein ACFQHW_08330 n=1 Tax=Lapidilactobacillus achengensis TaxID=2486000 RepID=A0ABW1URP7_9LACO|nr:YebC/PmpR family DNA-binding transcriptional regulator [Lapidilactobacillus achengensis]
MSGHSKWHNIQGRKNAQDSKRGKIFQKLSRELYMAAKSGDPDPANNPSLRLVMDKARAANMPKDNIERAVKKAQGGDGANYEEVTYEGYAPGGVAILVEALTDNKNRTASSVRVAFTRNGGNLGATGSVSYMFDRRGYIAIDRTTTDADEDQMLEDVMDAGGDDLQTSDDVYEIYTDAKEFAAVRDALEKKGYQLANAELTMIPQNTTPVPADKIEQFERMIDVLEDDDDIQEVYHAGELPDED